MCRWNEGAGSGAFSPEPALEPGLRSRSDGVWATVPRAQHRRRYNQGVPARGPDTSISGRWVVRELAGLIAERGKPGMIVSDNGTELTSNAVLAWPGEMGEEWHYIAPGKPMQNGF